MTGQRSVAHSLAIAAVVLTFVLVLMGALVTNNEAGDSVPDWPLAWGQLVPVGHLSGKVIYEYTHRVVAALVVALTSVLAVLVFVRERRGAAVIPAAAALCLVFAQALLGGARVRLGETHSYGIATLHAFTAQLFLGTLFALLMALSPRWKSAPVGGEARRGLKGLFVAAAAAVALQSLLGAGYRHRILGVWPHAVGAAVVALLAAAAFIAVRRQPLGPGAGSAQERLHLVAKLAMGTVGTQILLGVASYVLLGREPGNAGLAENGGWAGTTGWAAATVIVAVLHLGTGSALLVESVAGAFWASRSG